jgi:hypothetical protein
MAAFIEFLGPSVIGAGIIVPDDRPEVADGLRPWCAARSVLTLQGRQPWGMQKLSEFFDPKTGLFTKRCYTGAGWALGADIGRTCGLVAMTPPAGRSWPACHLAAWAGGYPLWLPGWAEPGEKGGLVFADGNRPQLRAKTVGAYGWRMRFAAPPRGKGWGKRGPDGSAFEGRFLDVVPWAYALDGVDSGELGDHLEAFGLGYLDYPGAVPLDATGAERMARVAEAVRALALALDNDTALWLTSGHDRLMGQGRLDLLSLTSPAGLASEAVRRAGVVPPLAKFTNVDHRLHDRAMGAHHGGWLSDELAGQGLFPGADVDVHSAYPAFASLLGWWRVMTAKQLRRQDVTGQVRALCERAARGNLAALFDRRTWARLGFTICEVVPGGEPWPAEAPDDDHPQGHAALRPMTGTVPLPFAWPDVVLAALLSGRVPEIVSATKLVPVGTQPGLRQRWPLYAGAVIGAHEDPAVSIVRVRDRAKAGDDDRLAAQIRVVVNALCYGNTVRRDVVHSGGAVSERGGEWFFPPIAATVTAASRLCLGMAERLVNDAGGTVAARDTDGLLLVASPGAGPVTLATGRAVGAISSVDLDAILRRFDQLDPFGTGQPFWKVKGDREGRPLFGLVLGLKRYVLATLDDNGDLAEIVEATEHALGGSVVDPPTMTGRDSDGRHSWTRAVAAVAVRQAVARSRGQEPTMPLWPWEQPGVPPFPCIEREQVVTHRRQRELTKRGLVVRPFGYVLSANTEWRSDPSPVALDPGGDLADWASLDWRGPDGKPVRVTTTGEPGAVQLDDVGARAWRWLQRRPVGAAREVVVVAELVRRVGKAGDILEAELVGPDDDTSGIRAVYDRGDPARFVHRYARQVGKRAFAAQMEAAGLAMPLKTAERVALGRQLRASTVAGILGTLRAPIQGDRRCGLEGCETWVWRRGAQYCHPRHREVAKKRRQRAAKKVVGRDGDGDGSTCPDQAVHSPAKPRRGTTYGFDDKGPL